eukprot:766841-Hanusia_phi.AAC.4
MSPTSNRSFTEGELRRLREMQEITYGNSSISKHRTVGASFMSSTNWDHSRLQFASCPDFTRIMDKPTGTTRVVEKTYSKLEKDAWKHQHTCGVYNLERSKAVYAAVRQRYLHCHDKTKVCWYEGEELIGPHKLKHGDDQPICRDMNGRVCNRRLRGSEEMRHFEKMVNRARSLKPAQIKEQEQEQEQGLGEIFSWKSVEKSSIEASRRRNLRGEERKRVCQLLSALSLVSVWTALNSESMDRRSPREKKSLVLVHRPTHDEWLYGGFLSPTKV